MVYCQKCGAENEDTARVCEKCGAPLVKVSKAVTPVDVPWVFIGTLIIVVTIAVCISVFGPLVGMNSALLMAFLVGGLVIGRMSKGVTITEAAIAGVLGALVFFFLLLGPLGLLYGLIFGIAGFVLAGVGGWIGEKWQEYAQKV